MSELINYEEFRVFREWVFLCCESVRNTLSEYLEIMDQSLAHHRNRLQLMNQTYFNYGANPTSGSLTDSGGGGPSGIENNLSDPMTGAMQNGLEDLSGSMTSLNNTKKSWSELKDTVNDLRKQLSNLCSMVPMDIQFRHLSDGRVRIYFLSTPPNFWETTLLYTDVQLNDTSSSNKRLQWKLVLEESVSSIPGNNMYFREVQLLLERKRLSTIGITSYELHKPSGKIIFPVSNNLYQCMDTGFNVSLIFLCVDVEMIWSSNTNF